MDFGPSRLLIFGFAVGLAALHDHVEDVVDGVAVTVGIEELAEHAERVCTGLLCWLAFAATHQATKDSTEATSAAALLLAAAENCAEERFLKAWFFGLFGQCTHRH